MIVAMFVQTIYSLVDTYWVSGLGADALAAMGFVFPFFFISMALSNGIGIGGGSAISRRIGAKDKAGADNVAVHTMIIIFLLALVFTLPFYMFAPQLFTLAGAGKTTELAVAYARVIFLGSVIIFFSNVANSILRAEGDSKRAMRAMILGAVLNIVLDPIFIYTFKMGIAGAAWATVISITVSALLMANWLFLRKDTYVSFNFKDLHFDKRIIRDILNVSIPASAEQLSMSLSMLFMNFIIVSVSSTDGVAVYSTGWRIATIAISPLMGIATAVVSVSGAAIGSRDYIKAKTALSYSTKLGFLTECGAGILIFTFATQIASIFTQAEGGAHITADLAHFLHVMCLFYYCCTRNILLLFLPGSRQRSKCSDSNPVENHGIYPALCSPLCLCPGSRTGRSLVGNDRRKCNRVHIALFMGKVFPERSFENRTYRKSRTACNLRGQNP